MAEQSGNRMPKMPRGAAWEGMSPDGCNDPDQGNFGSTFATGGMGGNPEDSLTNGGKGSRGKTFSSEESDGGRFEQGAMPSTECNYFSFED